MFPITNVLSVVFDEYQSSVWGWTFSQLAKCHLESYSPHWTEYYQEETFLNAATFLSLPLCGVWESNRRIQHFNQVSLEVFIKTAVEFLVLIPVHSKIKIIPILRCHWCTHRLLVQCISQQSVIGLGVGFWVVLFYKEYQHNFQRQNNQICAATITEWGQS